MLCYRIIRGEEMKDFPVFTTSNGVASLILKEVPYTHIAYIQIQDSKEPEALLKECVDFCVAVGSERVFATGSDILSRYRKYASVVRMSCVKENIPQTELSLFPVLEQTAEYFREIYNTKMENVPMASYMTTTEMARVVREKKGYFVHNNGVLYGIGILDGESIEAIASVVPGAGEEVLYTLCGIIYSEDIHLSVALENIKAVNLYRRCGFIVEKELNTWYQVL